MSIAKKSQLLDSLDGSDILLESPSFEDENDLRMDSDAVMLLDDEFSEEDSNQLDMGGDGEIVFEIGPELSLSLEKVPGALDQEDILPEEEIVVEEPEEIEVNDDPWSWSVKEFLPWLDKMMKQVPTHSGKETVGLERAIAYLQKVDKEISKAVRSDFNNNIDIDMVEKARDEIQRGIERLEDRHEMVATNKYRKKKNKKKADDESDELVKEAQKATHVGGIVVSVPLFISHLARVLINGMVSGGHDIEDMFDKLEKKYKLTDREKAELVQLLQDMNYPVRRDRGFMLDEEVDTRSSDNFDWSANYSA